MLISLIEFKFRNTLILRLIESILLNNDSCSSMTGVDSILGDTVGSMVVSGLSLGWVVCSRVGVAVGCITFKLGEDGASGDTSSVDITRIPEFVSFCAAWFPPHATTATSATTAIGCIIRKTMRKKG